MDKWKQIEKREKKGKKSIPFIKIKVIAFSWQCTFGWILFEKRNSNQQLINKIKFTRRRKKKYQRLSFCQPIKRKLCLMISDAFRVNILKFVLHLWFFIREWASNDFDSVIIFVFFSTLYKELFESLEGIYTRNNESRRQHDKTFQMNAIYWTFVHFFLLYSANKMSKKKYLFLFFFPNQMQNLALIT